MWHSLRRTLVRSNFIRLLSKRSWTAQILPIGKLLKNTCLIKLLFMQPMHIAAKSYTAQVCDASKVQSKYK